jgi:hypothetical protein
MKNALRFSCFASVLLLTFTAAAQTIPPYAPAPAPVPSAILAAKTVFISNAGADSGLFPSPFSGDPDRAYQQFFSTVQSWNRYQLISNPAQADFVFELRLTAPNGPQSPNKATGASDPLPMFRLIIYDRSTHYILWALTESIAPATLQKNHDRNFDEALQQLSEDLMRIARIPIPPAPVAPKPGKTRFGQRS